MKLATILVLVTGLGSLAAWRPSGSSSAPSVAYPNGYRSWVHVKSALVGPAHKNFASIGGFQHIYANAEAMIGYRTGTFPQGSILAFDWLDMRDNNGAFEEGARRQLDVMVKDSSGFASTGGWGFQRFVRDSKTELAGTPTPQQCFTCHQNLHKDDLVLSKSRP